MGGVGVLLFVVVSGLGTGWYPIVALARVSGLGGVGLLWFVVVSGLGAVGLRLLLWHEFLPRAVSVFY